MSHSFDPVRRAMIRDLLILSAAVATMPSCLRRKEDRRNEKGVLLLEKGQSETLAMLADTIIPRTDTPGAVDLKADAFALLMVQDCFKPEDLSLFRKGLEAFEASAKDKYGRRFPELEAGARKEFLQDLQKKGEGEDEASAFLKLYRALVVRGYTESEHFLTRVRPYELVPGRFKGCVPLES